MSGGPSFQGALPQAPSDLLDVCTGRVSRHSLAATLGHRVTGIDLASSMLRVARLKAKERGLEVRFIEEMRAPWRLLSLAMTSFYAATPCGRCAMRS
jgi:ubiquinone/menaquinone biosynthesis C-methylase UbiE